MRVVSRYVRCSGFFLFFILLTASLGCPGEPEELDPSDVGIIEDVGTDNTDAAPQDPPDTAGPEDIGPDEEDARPNDIGYDAGSDDDDVGPVPDCTTDEECEDGVCVDQECHECGEDAHCPDGFCMERQCVECLGNSQCDHFCVDNQCVDCTEDSHCALDELCGDQGFCEYNPDCDVPDFPDPENFADLNCDGVDGDASVAIFVSPDGNDANDGSATAPVRSIQRGIELAMEREERREVYIEEGSYGERVEITEAVSLYGGYRHQGAGVWTRSHDYETLIVGEEDPLGHRPLEIRGVTDDMELQMLTIVATHGSADLLSTHEDLASTPSTPIPLVLSNNVGHITASHLHIEAGRGSSGQDGASGAPGEEGTDAPFPTAELVTTPFQECSYSPPEAVGELGPMDGGRAGLGGGVETNPAGQRGGAPRRVENGQTYSGSLGGLGGFMEQEEECGNPMSGFNGADGSPGVINQGASLPDYDDQGNALDADPTTPALYIFIDHQGTSDARAFVHGPIDPEHHFQGRHGFHGASGSGGGGGGARITSDSACIPEPGGTGGAGGTGGCGGEGGYSGTFGGSSIGILVVNSTLTLSSSVIETRTGGRGGAGGHGGSGGPGGEGAEARHGYPGFGGEFIMYPYHGGDGGDGNPGGHGSHGAGGPGGASVGIAHHNAGLTTNDLSFDLGDPGLGGSGAGQNNDGLPGISAEIYEMP